MSIVMRFGSAAVLLIAGVLALVWAYRYGGGADAGAVDLTGPVVRWGLPATKLVLNVAAACTVGPLVLAAFALPAREPARKAALRLAGWSAVLWSASAFVYTGANFLFIANRPVSAGFDAAFIVYLTTIDAGRAGILTAAAAAAVAWCCFRLVSPGALAGTVLLAFSGLVPLVLKSHAAGGGGHADTTAGVVVHSWAAAVWVGGLVALVLLRPLLPGTRLATAVRRYSTLALVCFISLAGSGVLAALAQINTPADVLSPYGVIVAVKTGAFLILGLFGALHRRRVLARLDRDPHARRSFTVLAITELAVMGAASGLAAALARTETPAGAGATGTPLPGPGFWEYLSRLSVDPLWALACGFAAFFYLAGIRRLRTDRRRWPLHRTVSWIAGVALLFAVTNGGLRISQESFFNSQVLAQMTLSALVPLLLVVACPLTLARLTIRSRTDGSIGVREFLNGTVQRLVIAPASDPIGAACALAVALFVLYSTPLLEWSASGQIAYAAAAGIALLSGCLFTSALLGAGAGSGKHSSANLALAGAAVLYAVHGWRSGIRDLGANISGNDPGAAPFYGAPWESPAAMTIWSVAALTLCIIARVVAARRRSGSAPGPSGQPEGDGDAGPTVPGRDNPKYARRAGSGPLIRR
ncbi:bifunctional copper resistance protein CopD/cytochrome c oxidase assembly protein (plasmid) [Arthrobacter sp. FW305-BF8]|uniref:cytochrome c oxidase assembly protein n=1 Tax=Arthrobacter sp. FW305-BF8 TaxID=2879617 RepID=UPI001F2B89D9|nr:cytochrome c oxidase assembly protein [Arthrobacter sp. FW305-BF8]UKA56720.1 bifunctional copper resistance protein CopD/cytochrome c oxidase assembly protein [Arthrobacter sp. FW305-BF8]